ncbi:hypothetical protein MKX03_003959 [Papaver bracteatum]|nr:hypothetical protein MKX03_003959 [Papaver bracteatum]
MAVEDSSQQNQIDEGYASSITTDYSEEASSESDYSESDDGQSDYSESDDAESIDTENETKSKVWDGKENGKYVGPFACLNNFTNKYEYKELFFKAITNTEESDDETEDDTEDKTQEPTNSESGEKTTLNRFLSSKPTWDIWKSSWPEEGNTTEAACVSVYSYYKKHTDCGGYAVILRNYSAQTIAARANFSLDGKSYIFQVLSGLLAGLCLASDHGCYSPYVRCNSRIAVTLLCQIASRKCKCEGSKIGKICHRCASSIVPYMSDDCFETLVPLIEQLQDKYNYLGPSNFECVSRKMNEAAHYLAKEAKKNALLNRKELLVDYENGKLVDYETDMKPNEFPEKLVSFLLNDAYDSIYYNLDARGRLVG